MSTRMVKHNFKDGSIVSKEYKQGLTNISMHWHDFYELDIVLSGKGEMVCNGQSYLVKTGFISFLSPSDFHEYRNCEEIKLINIKFSEADVDHELLRNFLNIKSNILYAEPERLAAIETLCSLIGTLESGKYTKDYNRKLIESLIILFLGRCSKKIGQDMESEIIQQAVMYMNAHFRENPKMSDIAELCHLNENYFCRLFKKCTGMNYKEYLKKIKLEYAYKLITNTALPITTIALNCGYETQSHFNREFKKFFNCTPTSFRYT